MADLSQAPGGDVVALQRAAGNRAVSRLIQAKLTVGPVGDKYEQEADRLADSVMRTPNGVGADGRPPTVNRLQRSSGIGTESTSGGFEPSADFQSQLSEQLGGGTPLPGGVRNFMETRFGADFGNVKVHTGPQSVQLNRDIGAQAFTHGSDVFFGAGKYQPGSEGGNRLLTHELTHVVQQGGDANSGAAQRSPLIQRAVGFEFETNYKVRKRRGSFLGRLFGGTWRKMRKTEVIKSYGEGFRMEADENSTLGSTIEFVVDPPVQEDSRDRLIGIMDKLHEVAGQMDAGKNNPDVAVRLNTLTNDAAHNDIQVTPLAQGVTANPQVTGGISFDKLTTMMREVGKQGSEGPEEHKTAMRDLEGMAPQMLVSASARGEQVEGSSELKGLVAFATSYLRFGEKKSGNYPPLNYAKLVSNSILLRTDMGSMFKKLPADERRPYEENSGTFVQLMMDTAGLKTNDASLPVLERGVRKGQTPGTRNYNKLLTGPAVTISRETWLKRLTTGVDLLSSHHVPAMRSEFEGLGALGPITDVVGGEEQTTDSPLGTKDKGSGIVMEFRNMRKNIKFDQWRPMALRIFDYIVALNARQDD